MYEDQRPVNLVEQEFFPISSITVHEYHSLPDGKGPPTEVHLWLKIEGAEDTPFAIRFHSPRRIDELIVALMTHRKAVWG
ncbi:hypothetical protein LCGC14_1461950 [marine sediment metagenome]|uniref:Uncharacterized protein n=1 Tax=marine sediment metagenome TaxID=412755 RepID=A0A0F9LVH4_9ZZZZ